MRPVHTKHYRGGVEVRTFQKTSDDRIHYHVFRPSGVLSETTLVYSASFTDPKLAHEYADGLGRGFDIGVRLGRKLAAKEYEEQERTDTSIEQREDMPARMDIAEIQGREFYTRIRNLEAQFDEARTRIERDTQRIGAIEKFCIDDTDGPADRRRNVRLDNMETEFSGLRDLAQKTRELFLTHLHETSTGYTSKPHIDLPTGRREHRITRKINRDDFT